MSEVGLVQVRKGGRAVDQLGEQLSVRLSGGAAGLWPPDAPGWPVRTARLALREWHRRG